MRALSLDERRRFLDVFRDAVLVQAQPVADFIEARWHLDDDATSLVFPRPVAPWPACLLQLRLPVVPGGLPVSTLLALTTDIMPDDALPGSTIHGSLLSVFDAAAGWRYTVPLPVRVTGAEAGLIAYPREARDEVTDAMRPLVFRLVGHRAVQCGLLPVCHDRTRPDDVDCLPIDVPAEAIRTVEDGRRWSDHAGIRTIPMVLHCFSLLNCKNVRAEDTPVPPKLLKKRAKHGEPTPFRSYRTLVIDTRAAGQHGRLTRPGDARIAQHIVRGHFKTFTPDRPLLGRHVGTYWWPQVMRGAAKVGEVVKDYRVV